MRYAQNTLVSVEKSKAEIESILSKYKADQFLSGWDQDKAYIAFRLENRTIRFTIELPSKTDKAFIRTPTGRRRKHGNDIMKAWEQACRQRWRALALVIKAKDEFLAHIVLPDGSTAGAWLRPQIARAYETHKMPKLLMMGE